MTDTALPTAPHSFPRKDFSLQLQRSQQKPAAVNCFCTWLGCRELLTHCLGNVTNPLPSWLHWAVTLISDLPGVLGGSLPTLLVHMSLCQSCLLASSFCQDLSKTHVCILNFIWTTLSEELQPLYNPSKHTFKDQYCPHCRHNEQSEKKKTGKVFILLQTFQKSLLSFVFL